MTKSPAQLNREIAESLSQPRRTRHRRSHARIKGLTTTTTDSLLGYRQGAPRREQRHGQARLRAAGVLGVKADIIGVARLTDDLLAGGRAPVAPDDFADEETVVEDRPHETMLRLVK